ncbi:hypothetical protein YC2023_018309 [Brassica napus]
MKCEAMLNAFFFKQSQPLEKYHSMEKHMDFDLPEANEEKLRLWIYILYKLFYHSRTAHVYIIIIYELRSEHYLFSFN